MEKKTVKLDSAVLTGYEQDYIIRTIEKSHDYYEGDLLRKWSVFIDNPSTIIDIGANLGNHTVFWGKTLAPDRIISFEPFADNYERLCENIVNNGLSKYVTPLRVAVGDKNGKVSVSSFDSENMGSVTLQYSDDNSSIADIVTLDSLADELDLSDVTFVKIDTEGFEISVINGMRSVIERNMPIIWVEAGKDTVLDILSILSAYGYVLSDVEGANLLFLPPRFNAEKIDISDLLVSSLTLFEKVNVYYGNYEKSKSWVAQKDKVIAELKNNEEKANIKYKKAQEDYNTAKGWLESKNEQVDALQKKQKELLADIGEQNAQNESLRRQLDTANTANAELGGKLKKTQDDYITAKGWFESKRDQVVALQKEKETFLSEISKKEALNKSLSDKHDLLILQLDTRDAQNAALRERQSALIAQLETKDSQNMNLREIQLKLQSDFNTIAEQNRSLCEKQASLLAEINEKNVQNKALTEKQSLLSAEINEKNAQNKALTEKQVLLSAEINEKNAQNKALTEKQSLLSAEINEKNAQNKALTEKQSLLSAEIKEKNAKYSELQSTINELNKKINNLSSEKSELAQQLQTCIDEIGQDAVLLRSLKRQLLSLNSQLQQSRQKIAFQDEKLSKIYNTWYGKILLKGYKILKKIKHSLVRH